MVAWFESHDRPATAGSVACGSQGIDLGVGFALAAVEALAGNEALRIEDHAADGRVRTRRSQPKGGQGDGLAHG
jgi:hypothetical protein